MPAVCAPSRTMLNTGLSCFHAMENARRLSSYQPNDIEDAQSLIVQSANAPDFEPSIGDYVLWTQTFPPRRLPHLHRRQMAPG